MDSVEQSSNRGCVDDTLLSQVHFNGYNVFGEPEILPRIGDEYQAEIPGLSSKSDFVLAQKDQANEGLVDISPYFFGVGLPIPIMWIDSEVKGSMNELAEFVDQSLDPRMERRYVITNDFKGIHNTSVDEGTKVRAKLNDVPLGYESSKLEIVGVEEHKQPNIACRVPLPNSVYSSFSNEKEEAFLLGLYIFGKNLYQVKKFLESEGTGDVISHYYGKFYGSLKYRRWSELRKMKSRKCIFGQKIFTGMRQQELLLRLFPDLSSESQNRLLEVSKAFGEGRKSLEDYVFSLKAIVGLHNLVKAIGIGQGKQDLTGLVSEPLKSNHAIPPCPEIPAGKACSRLSTGEIINFLTGGFRLSKARSNDLFWEAVWPRLLARGWHSEQPENGYRHALVFLVPGIKKFSRRRLVKGNHYFDSVSDVLSKVASEPGLLDFEAGGEGKEEDGWVNGSDSDQESVDEERPCYLKPRTPNHATDDMKFTIVDTSRANGDVQMLRELRSLPSDMYTPSSSRGPLKEDGNICSSGPMNMSGSADTLTSSMDEIEVGKQVSYERKHFEHIASSWGSNTTGLDSTDVSVEVHNEQKDISRDIQLQKVVKGQQRPRAKPKMKSILDRTEKSMQKPGACNQSDTSCNFISMPIQSVHKPDEASCCSSYPIIGKMHIMADPSVEPLPSRDCELKGDARISLEHGAVVSSQTSLKVSSHEHLPVRTLIDLNLPVLPDTDFSDSGVGMHSQQDNSLCRDSNVQSGKVASSCLADSEEQQPYMNPRRQSTRNRPPTTRALEALAFGLLDTKRKRKIRDGCSTETLLRPSRRAAGRALVDENHTNGFLCFNMEDSRNDDCVSNMLKNAPI